MPRTGVEPARPKRTQGPQPCMSTNSITWADGRKKPYCTLYNYLLFEIQKFCKDIRKSPFIQEKFIINVKRIK